MENIIDSMRRAIKVEVNTSRNEITNGFNITFRGRDPKTTQAVTAALASKYIDEQTKSTINSTTSAKQFIENQTRQAKEELDAADLKRLEFMQKNVDNLPSAAATLIGQLSGLRDQQQAYISEVGRLQDRRSALSGQLGLIKKTVEQVKDEVIENTTDPKTTPAWAQLAARKADIEAQLQRMLTELRPKHPDVLSKQAELDSVKNSMDEMVNDWQARIKARQEKLKDRPDLQVASLEAELRLIDNEIKRQQKTLTDLDTQIGAVMQRINSVPGAEVALGALDREYQTKKSAYDGLLAQEQKISLGADAASQQQGEGIQVVDAAYLPSQPVAPRRLLLFALGLGLGLGFGMVLVAAFEIPSCARFKAGKMPPTTRDCRCWLLFPSY